MKKFIIASIALLFTSSEIIGLAATASVNTSDSGPRYQMVKSADNLNETADVEVVQAEPQSKADNFFTETPLSSASSTQQEVTQASESSIERDQTFAFGRATDEVITGDWNGDGETQIGVRRGNQYFLDVDGDGKWQALEAQVAEPVAAVGVNGVYIIDIENTDYQLVARYNSYRSYPGVTTYNYELENKKTGELTRAGFQMFGDSDDRNEGFKDTAQWLIDNGRVEVKQQDILVRFGRSTDELLLGDWNGDGKTQIGVRRGNHYFLDVDGDGKWKALEANVAEPVYENYAYIIDIENTDFQLVARYNSYRSYPGVTTYNYELKNKKTGELTRAGFEMFGDSEDRNEGFKEAAQWMIDNGRVKVKQQDILVRFGTSTDELLLGDWNGDGKTQIGVKRGNTYFLRGKGRFIYGVATDEVILGDWNGDGKTQIGVKRGNTYFLRGKGKFNFGVATDEVILGDWNGDGKTKIGVRRGNAYFLDTNGNGKWDGVHGDNRFNFGLKSDELVLGDWNGDGQTQLGVRRQNRFWLDVDGNGVWTNNREPKETWQQGAFEIELFATADPSTHILIIKNTSNGRYNTLRLKDLFWSATRSPIFVYEDFGFIQVLHRGDAEENYRSYKSVIDLYSGGIWTEDETTKIIFMQDYRYPGYVAISKTGGNLIILHNPGTSGKKATKVDRPQSTDRRVTYSQQHIITIRGNHLKVWGIAERRYIGESEIPSYVTDYGRSFSIRNGKMVINYCAQDLPLGRGCGVSIAEVEIKLL